jgi:hypothetical protein
VYTACLTTDVPSRIRSADVARGAALTTRMRALPPPGRLMSSSSTFSATLSAPPNPATVYALPCVAVRVVLTVALPPGSEPSGRHSTV